MYVNIGVDSIVTDSEIIGFFDLDTSSVSKRTRDYLSKAEKKGEVLNIAADLPKTFVVCSNGKGDNRIYLSQLSPQTLSGRIFLNNGN